MKKLIKYELLSLYPQRFMLLAPLIVFPLLDLIFLNIGISSSDPVVILIIFLGFNMPIPYSSLLAKNDSPLYLLSPVDFLKVLIVRQSGSLIFFTFCILGFLISNYFMPHANAPVSFEALHFFLFLGIYLFAQSAFVSSVILIRRWVMKINSPMLLKEFFEPLALEDPEALAKDPFSASGLFPYGMLITFFIVMPLFIIAMFFEPGSFIFFLMIFFAYSLNIALLLLNSRLLELYGIE